MPIPENVEKPNRASIRQEAYQTLQEWIVDGTLKPGEQMKDKELAESLGVSRTPVREAMQRLEEEGLVHTAANRWTRVASVDLGEAERIYPIIQALESLALNLAKGNLQSADLQEMEETISGLERALADNNPLAASKAERRFHEIFVDKSRNTELIKILHNLKLRRRRLMVTYFGVASTAGHSITEHRAVLDALRAGDHEQAQETLEENWALGFERFTEYAKNKPRSEQEEGPEVLG